MAAPTSGLKPGMMMPFPPPRRRVSSLEVTCHEMGVGLRGVSPQFMKLCFCNVVSINSSSSKARKAECATPCVLLKHSAFTYCCTSTSTGRVIIHLCDEKKCMCSPITVIISCQKRSSLAATASTTKTLPSTIPTTSIAPPYYSSMVWECSLWLGQTLSSRDSYSEVSVLFLWTTETSASAPFSTTSRPPS